MSEYGVLHDKYEELREISFEQKVYAEKIKNLLIEFVEKSLINNQYVPFELRTIRKEADILLGELRCPICILNALNCDCGKGVL